MGGRFDSRRGRFDLSYFLKRIRIFDRYDDSYYSRYVLVPEKLLLDIFKNQLKADIILTYAIVRAEKSLQDCLDKGEEFSDNEIMMLISHVLTGILDLYDNGCAHCDIKPSNIMIVSRPHYNFCLSDFGSIHSEKLGSGSGTELFFSKTEYQHLKESGLNDLECRTLMDGFALALTIYSLAAGHIPSKRLLNYRVVENKWPGQIFDAYKILYNVGKSSIEKMKALNLSFALQMHEHEGCTYNPLKNMSCIGWAPRFEKKLIGDDGIKYGRFYEQIRFSPVFDPIMKIEGRMNEKMMELQAGVQFSENLWNTLPRPLLILYSDSKSQKEVVFHAPDDARTLKRATSFEGYIPCSLANTVPTDEELEKILQMENLCNQEIRKHNYSDFLLPSAKDIVRIDGEWKILWFCGESHNLRYFDFREYFSHLYDSIKAISNLWRSRWQS